MGPPLGEEDHQNLPHQALHQVPLSLWSRGGHLMLAHPGLKEVRKAKKAVVGTELRTHTSAMLELPVPLSVKF